MNTAISFIIVLGILILVHELGHFLLAKLFRVRVLKFSLGFGPRVVGRRVGETEYQLSAFPLGGYVKMLGEDPDEQDGVAATDLAAAFHRKPVWQRAAIVAAGPVFNLLFAVLLFWGMFTLKGLPQPVETTVIGAVSAASVAESVGIKAGDEVLQINGAAVRGWSEVSTAVQASGGRELSLQVRRGDETLHFSAVPTMQPVRNIFGEETGQRYMLGIARKEQLVFEKVGPVSAMGAALEHTWMLTSLTLQGIVKIIQRVVPASELGGPIRIAEIAGQQLAEGWMNFLSFMGLLSVNLAVLNFLPVPVLDGGHLVFLAAEGIRRRPLGTRTLEAAQKVGMVLLGSLMLFVFYNDIFRLVQRWLGQH
ncbi:MAG: RIP metalloprotease RseP [Desulfobulbaceae bacterium A2]|nr:MAG: RIP metalloprotease RseP [Desulfobulbaceae bacterium A2]